MASQDYWADPPQLRDQQLIFCPTLDAAVSDDDPVRSFDSVLSDVDWSEFEAEYHGKRGQPPIHPRWIASLLLYGLCCGIRSSRKLEEAACYRVDFLWLLHGQQIDHTTIARFRTRFRDAIKGLFKQVGMIAMSLGLVRLKEVAFDGTRVKANNSRYNTRTAKTLEEKLAVLDAEIERMLAESEACDLEEQRVFESHDSTPPSPKDVAELEQRRQRMREALEKAQALDEARRKSGVNPKKKPAQVPTTDPDSRVMPNKEGGYAPNYTPTTVTDGHSGFILDCDVTSQVNEGPVLPESVDRIQETFGSVPEKLLTDAGNNSGELAQAMEDRGVEMYAPVESNQPQEGNPAKRDDPSQPVPESEWEELPKNAQGKLDKSCFVYDAEGDRYYCPQGRELPFESSYRDKSGDGNNVRRRYRSPDCSECPLQHLCLGPTNTKGRTITRVSHEKARERVAERMKSPEARELYNQRPRIAETTFGILKAAMGLRQFLLRGLDKVKTEWCWAATAFNIRKIANALGKVRAESARQAVNAVS